MKLFNKKADKHLKSFKSINKIFGSCKIRGWRRWLLSGCNWKIID